MLKNAALIWLNPNNDSNNSDVLSYIVHNSIVINNYSQYVRAGPVILVNVLPSVFSNSSPQTLPISVVIFSPVEAIVSSVKQTLHTSFLQEDVIKKMEQIAIVKTRILACMMIFFPYCFYYKRLKLLYSISISKNDLQFHLEYTFRHKQ